jgi:hypothetical protein
MHCLSCSKPCIKPSSYSISQADPPPQSATPPPRNIICVAAKGKGGRRRIKNVFVDDHGYPDQTDDHSSLLHNIKSGHVLRKFWHPPLPINMVDPSFDFPLNEALHGAPLHQQLNLSHLDNALQARIYALVRKYWSVFDERGVWVPIKNYECVIDTGNVPPIAIKNIRYGPKELPIMQKAIAGLEQVGQIRQIHNGRWLFKCVLAAKPYHEHISNINEFVWRFCVNYQPLNSATRIIAYPIPHCDSAVFVEFGNAQFLWLFDAPSGYHQLAVERASQEKLAFQGPGAIKWTYTVMPFGPTNGPATFISMIYDLDSQWKALATSVGIIVGDKTDTRIIVDDITSHGLPINTSLLYM